MKIKFVFLLPLMSLLTHCTRNAADLLSDKIDVSDIYMTDNIGNLINNPPNDNQWKLADFNDKELVLFSSMDTANLAGTKLPAISNSYYGYPNPFTNTISVSATLAQPLNGEIVVKYVVVNNRLGAVQKGCSRISVSSWINFMLPGNFSIGNYRLYYTFSAESHPHFFKSWGNIQKR
jgi:hypothetical protein